jgi:BirA family biotin operon repressor/biotin-[acetyl-CoA-carboxylase] ligase
MTDSRLPAPFSLLALDSAGSTNDTAKALAASGRAADFLVVTARRQTAGRGRHDRVWVSEPGNLHCSLLLSMADMATAPQVGFVAAVALVDALSGLVPGGGFRCKWPNDVLSGANKVAGMLLEAADGGWLVLGIGVDVAYAPPADQVMTPAVSLAGLGYRGDAAGVLAAFCTAFGPWFECWRAEGFAPLREAWLERSGPLGEPLTVRPDGQTLHGTFAGLDPGGGLLLDTALGGRRRILAGDVFLR